MKLTILAAYLLLVVVIGWRARSRGVGTSEEFFVASRSIGPFVLLMTLFGTNMTSFSLLGASGEAYRKGVGVFALMASSTALITPLFFLTLGRRSWQIAKRHGYLTQVEFFRDRWQAPTFGLLLFVVLVTLLVPYLLIGILGGGITFEQISGGTIPQWLGSLIICGVVLVYVWAGGNRSTAWVNTFQTLVFMTLGTITFFWVIQRSGGLGAAFARVDPSLLHLGDKISPLKLLTYTAIPMSVGMFPHIFNHWLSARSAAAFRLPVIAYPICLVIVWVPSVTLGVLGTVDVPGLVGPAANSVLILMIDQYAQPWLAGLLAAGVFAAVMSSLDSQVLSLSSMFTRDIVDHYRGRTGTRSGASRQLTDAQRIRWGRTFILAVMFVTYGISLIVDRSLFRLGVWSFSGFAALVPIAIAALYWRRSTRAGAYASLLTTTAFWGIFLVRGWNRVDISIAGTGIQPVAGLLLVSTTTMIVGSLLTSPPPAEHVARFFPAPHRSGPDRSHGSSTR